MRGFKPFSSTIAVSFLFAAALAAQVPSRPEIVGAGAIDDPDAVLDNLSQHYFSGRWDLLQKEIGRLGRVRKMIGHRIDPSANFYLVVFLSHEEGGAPRLVRFAWHIPAPEPYAARIPGREEIFEIVLGAGSDVELKTSYTLILAPFGTDNPLCSADRVNTLIGFALLFRRGAVGHHDQLQAGTPEPAHNLLDCVGIPDDACIQNNIRVGKGL
jgi:hypothetical protein